jgi:hypothetical protein
MFIKKINMRFFLYLVYIMQGGRKLSQWNLLVKKVYHEGKAKNSKYEFKQALVDASKRKSEMGHMKSSSRKTKGRKSSSVGGKSRRRRTRTKRRH